MHIIYIKDKRMIRDTTVGCAKFHKRATRLPINKRDRWKLLNPL